MEIASLEALPYAKAEHLNFGVDLFPLQNLPRTGCRACTPTEPRHFVTSGSTQEHVFVLDDLYDAHEKLRHCHHPGIEDRFCEL